MRRKDAGVRYQARSKDAKPRNFGFCIHPELLAAVERDARKFNCSCSFVINTAIAAIMSIDVGEKYWVPKDVKEKKNGSVVKFRKRA